MTGSRWMLRHPDLGVVCILTEEEFATITLGDFPDGAFVKCLNLVPFDEFLAAAKLKARTGSPS